MKKTILFLLLWITQSYGQFPSPYCSINFSDGVEPITKVQFANINNVTSAELGGTAHEDFTAMVANVYVGSTYNLIVAGNTNGTNSDGVVAFIDWNNDNQFSISEGSNEFYIVGILNDTSGDDGTEISKAIYVPSTVTPGNYRMRIVKKYSQYSQPCNPDSFGLGQAEDYTLNVTTPACMAPSQGVATIVTSTQATLSWTSGGTDASEIVVQVAGLGIPAEANDTGTNVTGNTYTASGLTADLEYEFYVRHECTSGTVFSTWSGPYKFFSTLAPHCPTLLTPTNGSIVPIGNINFSWAPATTGGAPTSYDFYIGITPDANIFYGNFTTTSANLLLDMYGVTIYWKVIAKNQSGQSENCTTSFSFTTEDAPGYCLNGGLFPSATYTPEVCDGTTENVITNGGIAGEYSNVNVEAGKSYKFISSVDTDFITLSTDNGATPAAYGTTPLIWTATTTGIVRFYTHLNNTCEMAFAERERKVVCSSSLANTTQTANGYVVYPNPVQNILNISGTDAIKTVEIVNLMGQTVFTQYLKQSFTQISTSSLTAGTYFVRISSDKGTETIKLIKE